MTGPVGVPAVSRRQFLTGSAGSMITGYLFLQFAGAVPLVGEHVALRGTSPKPTFTTTLRRREDLLKLRFEFFNLILRADGQNARLVRSGSPAVVVAVFPPQYLLEQAFFEENGQLKEALAQPGAVGARLAGETRLAFRLPETVTEIPFTGEVLLNWTPWPPAAVPAAFSTNSVPPALREPLANETAIEAPWWLVLSPDASGGWAHGPVAVEREGRTELWHTRFAARSTASGTPTIDERQPDRRIRAVWALDPAFPDYLAGKLQAPGGGPYPQPGLPFRASLTPKNRLEIVRSSADWRTAGFTPSAVEVDRLMLTPLGAYLDLHGNWMEERQHPQLDLEEWRHRGTLGRDHYVRVVEEGYLFPFGHRVRRVTITERKPQATPSGEAAAYLLQRVFIVVVRASVTYPVTQPTGLPQPNAGRAFPFVRVDAVTRVTPDVTPQSIGGIDQNKVFVPTVGGSPFRFQFLATDRSGARIPVVTPAVFVLGTAARDGALMDTLRTAYNGLATGDATRPPVDLGGRRVALAAETAPGAATVEALSMTFGADAPSGPLPDAVAKALQQLGQPAFWPTMARAQVRLAAAEQASRGTVAAPTVSLDPAYVQHGFGVAATKGEVFARLEDPVQVPFVTEGSGGGVVTPSIAVTALSRRLGAVAGDPAIAQSGQFDPEQVFAALTARCLGGVDLRKLAKKVPDVTTAQGAARALRITQEPQGGQPGAPNRLVTRLRWAPEVQGEGVLKATATSSLVLDGTFVNDLVVPTGSTYEVRGELRNMTLAFPPQSSTPFLAVPLHRVAFTARQGAVPDVEVDIGDVLFDGVLKFVRDLRSYLEPALALSDTSAPIGPTVEVTPAGVTSGYSLPLPALEIGVFLLQNVVVTSKLSLPFSEQPARFHFAFSSRENPFLVTVSALGGGGFFAMSLGADDIEMLEGSFEFGAAVALNLGVAKGTVQAVGGIYYKYDAQTGKAEFEGYERQSGRLRVLGLVTVSATFYMGLKYVPADDKAIGKAKLKVEIDLTFFSKTVTLSVERKYGGNADPSFGDLMPAPSDWSKYCDAFAIGGAA